MYSHSHVVIHSLLLCYSFCPLSNLSSFPFSVFSLSSLSFLFFFLHPSLYLSPPSFPFLILFHLLLLWFTFLLPPFLLVPSTSFFPLFFPSCLIFYSICHFSLSTSDRILPALYLLSFFFSLPFPPLPHYKFANLSHSLPFPAILSLPSPSSPLPSLYIPFHSLSFRNLSHLLLSHSFHSSPFHSLFFSFYSISRIRHPIYLSFPSSSHSFLLPPTLSFFPPTLFFSLLLAFLSSSSLARSLALFLTSLC